MARWSAGRVRVARILLAVLLCGARVLQAMASEPEVVYFKSDPKTGTSQAAMVSGKPLVQTTQFLPLDAQRAVVGKGDVAEQTRFVLKLASDALRHAHSDVSSIAKLNVYLKRNSDRAAVDAVFAKQFPGPQRPAACFVETSLPVADCLVALDVVAAGPTVTDKAIRTSRIKNYSSPEQHVSVLHDGARVYVAGQAEKGKDLAEATRLTLASLRKTLTFLGLTDLDIVQVKSFVNPQAELGDSKGQHYVDVVRREIADFYGAEIAPLAFVDWKLPLIEIELVVRAGAERNGDVIEFITPPGMTSSPVFARVTRINRGPTIFVSGLYGDDTSDPTREVESLIQQLDRTLKEAGSDLRHMVKATYYVATDETSKKLNELRPKYYDPQRPPAASKAVVTGTGRADRNIVIDMIAVPVPKNEESQQKADASPTKEELLQQAKAVLAPIEGDLKLPGLKQPVEVLRDRWGIPHIYAQNSHDLFLAQGYVVAQDRLFQIDLWRRVGLGELAEIYGESSIEGDRFARLMLYRGDMQAEWSSYSDDAREIATAFTSGINAWIDAVSDKLPIEFQVLGYRPKKWKPEDVLARMSGLVMVSNWEKELSRARLIASVGVERARQLAPTDPVVEFAPDPKLDLSVLSPKILAGYQAATRPLKFEASKVGHVFNVPKTLIAANENSVGWHALTNGKGVARADAAALTPIAERSGRATPITLGVPDLNDLTSTDKSESNNWVIDGTMSASGKPLLAGDPHRTTAHPSLRYLVHLSAPGWNVIGAGEPALPGVAIGHNDRVAWAFTIVGTDQADLFVEETQPDNPRRYKVGDKWEDMRVVRESITVKGREQAESVELRFTRHGPVIYQDDAKHIAIALKWVGSEPGSAGYLASLSVARSKSAKELVTSLERWKIPALNFVFADVDGAIGWVAAGLTPIRPKPASYGLLPVPGASSQYDWLGFLKVADLPQVHNPERHFVATANHNILPPGYGKEIAYDWAAPYRFKRIEQRLKAAPKFTTNDFESIQHESTSVLAQQLVQIVKSNPQAFAPEQAAFVKLLSEWDGNLSRESAAAALHSVWLQELMSKYFEKLIPNDLKLNRGDLRSQQVLVANLTQPKPEPFGAEPTAARDRLLRETLATAITQTKKLLGDYPPHWKWGRLHTATFRHPLASLSPAYEQAFNLGPVARSGDVTTPNNTRASEDFQQIHGASYRHVLDLADWDRGMATSTPGQSGQLGSEHFGDLLPLWGNDRYFPLSYSRGRVEAVTAHRLLLKP